MRVAGCRGAWDTESSHMGHPGLQLFTQDSIIITSGVEALNDAHYSSLDVISVYI